ncbi:MAG TPA: hypothetical protein VME66_02720 [Candidatus Acidoferrales bacterium]|nr:hypothetical protein [Candidatus Acidoferrales bacterium]
MMLVLGALLASAAPSFGGIALGDTRAAVIAERGDPLQTTSDGKKDTYEYVSPSGDAIQIVWFTGDAVSTVAMIFSPIPRPGGSEGTSAEGITLGEPLGEVPKLDASRIVSGSGDLAKDGTVRYRGEDGGIYEFAADKTRTIVGLIALEAPDGATAASPAPAASPVTIHGGTSLEDAIVLTGSDAAGVLAEHVYLLTRKCGSDGRWQFAKQSLVLQHGRSYDRIDATCSTGGEARAFFFDVTATMGG